MNKFSVTGMSCAACSAHVEKEMCIRDRLLTGRDGKWKFVIDGVRNMSRCIPDELFISV